MRKTLMGLISNKTKRRAQLDSDSDSSDSSDEDEENKNEEHKKKTAISSDDEDRIFELWTRHTDSCNGDTASNGHWDVSKLF
uniref:Uncharacterized protein n=1 Tax=Caenorhabditis japonica TaxID=281687 RepID=A0A8R1EKE6_CAEJA